VTAGKISTRKVALLAVFIALSAVIAEFVPGIPIIGVSGASIKFDAAIAPIWGLILGPYLGALAGFVGGVIVASSPFSVLTSLSTGASAFVAGAFTQEYFHFGKRKVRGWIVAALVLGFLIAGWYGTWIGQRAPFYPSLHFLGLLLILGGRGSVARWSRENSKGKLLLAVPLASYAGIISDHMVGNLAFITSVGLFIQIPPELDLPALFMAVIPISAVERAVLTAIATLIGVSLILALQKAGLYVRDRNEEN